MRELEQLQKGEVLLLDRRRRNECQGKAAKRLNISRNAYGDHERRTELVPKHSLGHLADHEVVSLYRRRAGMSRPEIARAVNCSVYWITEMERGRRPCGRLVEFWEV